MNEMLDSYFDTDVDAFNCTQVYRPEFIESNRFRFKSVSSDPDYVSRPDHESLMSQGIYIRTRNDSLEAKILNCGKQTNSGYVELDGHEAVWQSIEEALVHTELDEFAQILTGCHTL